MDDENAIEMKMRRQEREKRARQKQYTRQPYSTEDILIARESNEAGLFASQPYHGETFDESRFRVVRGGWDHDHCYVCFATILPGDEWWVVDSGDEVGLCQKCYSRLFDSTGQTLR
jgi:hypothetical protein